MSAENRPENQPHLEPAPEEQWEHAFGTAIRKAVDDLFTHRLIAERVEGMAGDERVVTLLDNQKLILVEQIEEAAGRTLDEVLGYLDILKAQPGLPLDAVLDRREDVDPRLEGRGLE